MHRQSYWILLVLLIGAAACTTRPYHDAPTPEGIDIPNPGAQTACTISPAFGDPVRIRTEPRADAPQIDVLPPTTWVPVRQRSADGWYEIRFENMPVDGGWVDRRDVNLAQPCACGPQCGIFMPVGATNAIETCNLVLPAGEEFTLYNAPYAEADVYDTMTAGYTAQAQARVEDWIGFDPGIDQPANTGLDRLRWVQVPPDAIVLDGMACNALPVYEFELVGTE
ncbi:MAG: SH3 domain-containing protein [Anaerolineae bacterium]|nr:SH3 domain-containing protein [Anaerolineae bacterium]